MQPRFARVLTAVLFAAAAFGQPLDKTFHFAHTESVQDIQQMATVVRAIVDFKQIAPDTEQKLLSVRGTAGQIALAEWLINELDQPADAPRGSGSEAHKFLVSGSDPDGVVRVFFLKNAGTVQNLQEVATTVRSITGIRRAFTYNAPAAIVFRGSAAQIELADWLVNNLDIPANVPEPAKRQFTMATTEPDNAVRVFYVAHAGSDQSFQELATLVRTIGDVRRLFTYNAPRAIAVRGTAEQMGLAEWLVDQLDQPPGAAKPGRHEYSVSGPGDPDNLVRIFSLSHAATVQRLQEVATQVRVMTQARRLFTYNAPRIIAVRGTPSQVEHADQLIHERDK
ncbi:MAG: hypothetical protein M3O35_01285 [Acidobacteriota bacterium]|nr:hypothetical protein [Acidobacteriota bacterium]